jgi:hypothetical protein
MYYAVQATLQMNSARWPDHPDEQNVIVMLDRTDDPSASGHVEVWNMQDTVIVLQPWMRDRQAVIVLPTPSAACIEDHDLLREALSMEGWQIL